METSELLKRVRKIEIKTRGLSKNIFAGEYHSAFKGRGTVVIPQRKKDPIVFDTDEYPKRDTNLEKMAKLKPIFADGVTTAGNASGRNDGASALVLMSADKAKELGLKPIARIIAGAAAGVLSFSDFI